MAGGALIQRQRTTIGVNCVPAIMTLSVLRPREALKSTSPLRLTMDSPHQDAAYEVWSATTEAANALSFDTRQSTLKAGVGPNLVATGAQAQGSHGLSFHGTKRLVIRGLRDALPASRPQATASRRAAVGGLTGALGRTSAELAGWLRSAVACAPSDLHGVHITFYSSTLFFPSPAQPVPSASPPTAQVERVPRPLNS